MGKITSLLPVMSRKGNGNGPWVCVPIDEHYEMSYQPGNFFQDPAPMNRPNINATPVDYFEYL
jgi:hypothetical protein